MATSAKQFEVEFLRKEKVAKDAYSFHFKRPPEFNFIAGQFIRLILKVQNPDERGSARFFSIASSPTEKDFVMMVTRAIKSSFKKTLLEMEKGTKVKIAGPYGKFILQVNPKTTHVFLAGGIGITPVRSIIRFCADTNRAFPIVLFTSFRTVEDMIFKKEFDDLSSRYSWLKLVQTITRPEESITSWPGLVGRINKELILKYLKNLSNCLFYISGPPQMVDNIQQEITSLGVEESSINTERFTGY
ncbi:FAD-dependent oxidoreductase [Candidatus Roizmanbacteria bacterium]|nr:FAD-dependent oxidoreductase [Candidatus Roizmanbacteria bacterium]